MLNNIISIADKSNIMTTGEALGFGGSVTLLGVSIVFAALVSLIVLTIIYPKIAKYIIGKANAVKDKRAAKKAAKLEAKSGAGQAEPALEKAVQEATADTELIAVITAAIAASLGTSSNGITIKSLRRSGANIPAWGLEGRNEQVYNRF